MFILVHETICDNIVLHTRTTTVNVTVNVKSIGIGISIALRSTIIKVYNCIVVLPVSGGRLIVTLALLIDLTAASICALAPIHAFHQHRR